MSVLCDALASAPDIKVAGTASNGAIALARIPQLNPDIMTEAARGVHTKGGAMQDWGKPRRPNREARERSGPAPRDPRDDSDRPAAPEEAPLVSVRPASRPRTDAIGRIAALEAEVARLKSERSHDADQAVSRETNESRRSASWYLVLIFIFTSTGVSCSSDPAGASSLIR